MPGLKVDWMQIICTRKVFETWTCKAYLGTWGKKQVIFLQDRRSTEEEGVCYNWVDWGGCLNVCTCLPDDSRRAWWLAHCGTLWHTGAHCGTECGTLCASHISRGDPPPEQSPRLTMYSLLSSYIATCMHHIYVPAPDISQEPTKYLQHLWSQSYGEKMYFEKPSRNGILLHLNWNRQFL